MKKEIPCIFVCALFLIVIVLPVVATHTVDEEEPPSCGLAMTTVSDEIEKFQIQNDLEVLYSRSSTFYGYCAWDPSGNLVQGPVYFDSTNPGIVTQIASTTSTEFISGGTWATGKWYGCEFAMGVGESLIWKIHPVIGEMTPVGNYDPENTGISFNGLAYDTVTGIMYGCSSTALYKVNMNTWASSWIGNFNLPDPPGYIMIGIAFDSSGSLYGIELINDSLYSINTENGVATRIGNGLGINLNYAQDMAYDIDNDILYLSAYTTAPVKEGALYTCDTFTGAATKVGTFQGGAEITGFAIPYSYENKPPDVPTIDGPTEGKPGVEYSFTLNTTDPELDELSYYIDWGDKTNSGWLGPHHSGETITVNHTWDKIKYILPYTVKAKARDTQGAESDWGTLKINIPVPVNQQGSQSQSIVSQQSTKFLLFQILEQLLYHPKLN